MCRPPRAHGAAARRSAALHVGPLPGVHAAKPGQGPPAGLLPYCPAVPPLPPAAVMPPCHRAVAARPRPPSGCGVAVRYLPLIRRRCTAAVVPPPLCRCPAAAAEGLCRPPLRGPTTARPRRHRRCRCGPVPTTRRCPVDGRVPSSLLSAAASMQPRPPSAVVPPSADLATCCCRAPHHQSADQRTADGPPRHCAAAPHGSLLLSGSCAAAVPPPLALPPLCRRQVGHAAVPAVPVAVPPHCRRAAAFRRLLRRRASPPGRVPFRRALARRWRRCRHWPPAPVGCWPAASAAAVPPRCRCDAAVPVPPLPRRTGAGALGLRQLSCWAAAGPPLLQRRTEAVAALLPCSRLRGCPSCRCPCRPSWLGCCNCFRRVGPLLCRRPPPPARLRHAVQAPCTAVLRYPPSGPHGRRLSGAAPPLCRCRDAAVLPLVRRSSPDAARLPYRAAVPAFQCRRAAAVPPPAASPPQSVCSPPAGRRRRARDRRAGPAAASRRRTATASRDAAPVPRPPLAVGPRCRRPPLCRRTADLAPRRPAAAGRAPHRRPSGLPPPCPLAPRLAAAVAACRRPPLPSHPPHRCRPPSYGCSDRPWHDPL